MDQTENMQEIGGEIDPISHSVWSLEVEFERFIKLAQSDLSNAKDDIHWLRLKVREWEDQLSLLEKKVSM